MLKQKASVSDARQAVVQLEGLLRTGRNVEVDLLEALGRFEYRGMDEALGYRSFWDFLTRRLGLLECAAFHRMHASRLVVRFPGALDRLRDGRLCPTILVVLRDVLDESNAEALFDEVVGKSREKVVELVRDLKAKEAPVPEPGTPTRKPYTIRKAPPPTAKVATTEVLKLREQLLPAPTAAATAAAESEVTAESAPAPVPVVLLVASRERRGEIRPLGEDLYDVSLRVRRGFVDALEEARIAEGHAVPDGDLETLLLRGLELLIERAGKKSGKIKTKQNKTIRETSQDPDKKYITRSLRREVLERDGHSCRWELAEGGFCESRERIEPDHILSRALGGKTVASNLRALCHAHNAQAARDQLGADFVAARIREAKAARKIRNARKEAANDSEAVNAESLSGGTSQSATPPTQSPARNNSTPPGPGGRKTTRARPAATRTPTPAATLFSSLDTARSRAPRSSTNEPPPAEARPNALGEAGGGVAASRTPEIPPGSRRS